MIQWIYKIPRKTFVGLAVSWTLVILFATLKEDTGDKGWLALISQFDKIIHFGIFAIWSSLVSLSFVKHPINHFFSFILVMLAGMLLGFGTEYFQAFVPGRSSDPLDFAFDVIGVGIGIAFTFVIKKND